MSKQLRTTQPCKNERLEWGGLRAFDADLRGWAGRRLPYSAMARRISETFGIAVTSQGVRCYCLREGFDNANSNNNNNSNNTTTKNK